MKFNSRFLFIGLFFLPFVLWAQEQQLENPQEWIAKIESQTKTVVSLQAKFEQQKVLSFLDGAVISQGEFWFLQPNKIRWEYQKPYHYTMIMNDGKLIVTDGGTRFTSDLRSNQMFDQMNSLITGSIRGDLLSDDKNYRKEFYQNEGHIIARFYPNDEQLSSYLDYMEIWFSKVNLSVKVMLMHEPSGDYTKMIFSDIKQNKNIKSDVFR
jgi:outer membrane lipoprotein carrier protein